jgi:LmbE family N-acetylglucosaminyl deacetylase
MRAFLEDAAVRGWSKLRPIRNRRFASRLRHDPVGPVLVLSPHPDDAVIDCWSVVASSAPVHVVNLFAGVPPPNQLAYFDRLAGARDSAGHLRRRIAEDREALALAGRAPLNLDFLAHAYRRGRPEPSFAALDGMLAEHIPIVSLAYAPAALGAPHPDHALARAYALRLARAGVPVRLYADLPYCTAYGWPEWVCNEESEQAVDVDAYWRSSAGEAAALLTRARAEVVSLTAEDALAKLVAMRTYRAEFPVLDRGPIGQLSNPAIHGREVFWPANAGAV